MFHECPEALHLNLSMEEQEMDSSGNDVTASIKDWHEHQETP